MDDSASANTAPRQALLIGGGAGVGKTTVGWEVSVLLRSRDVAHCVIEGDVLDQIHPAPADDPARSRVTERNLAALWANYAALGQRRLVYTNTVSVLEVPMFRRALGPGPVDFTLVLLTAGEDVVRERLARRETGSQLEPHIGRSLRMAAHLEAEAPEGTVRVATDGLGVEQVAARVVAAAGW
jgi:predicted kinase